MIQREKTFIKKVVKVITYYIVSSLPLSTSRRVDFQKHTAGGEVNNFPLPSA